LKMSCPGVGAPLVVRSRGFKKRAFVISLFAAFSAVPTAGFSQPPALTERAPDPRVVAHMAVNLLAQGCTPGLGKPDDIDRTARVNGFAPARPEMLSLFARFGSGATWVLQRQDIDLALHRTADGLQCRVLARSADRETAHNYFRSVIEGVKAPGVSVTKRVDDEKVEAGRKYYQIGYELSNDARPGEPSTSFVLTTFPQRDAPFAIIGTVAATKRQ